MANEPMGAVPSNVMSQMLGNMQLQEGMARIFTAGQPAGVVQSAMASARERGAMAAENIRARYFQAEFKQIQDARIKPLQDEMKAAVASRDAALKMTVMPVNRILDPGQTRAAIDATEPPPPPQFQTVPGKAAADGTQTQESVQLPGQPLPNPALSSGPQLNSMVSEEALAFIDPVSGDPVRVSSARGISHAREVEHEFWGTYGRIVTDMLNVYGEYKGNPFAENAIARMIDEVSKQANIATTGTGDPATAQKQMEDRQAWELDQSRKQQDLVTGGLQQDAARIQADVARQNLQKGGLGIDQAKAGIAVGATRARDLAQTRPEFRKGFLGEDLASKPNWDTKDATQAAVAVDAFDTAEKERLLRADKSHIFRIAPELVNIPENWQTALRQGYSAWRPVYGQEITTIVNTTANRLRQMPDGERDAILKQFGADDEVMRHVNMGDWTDPNVKAVITAYAQSTGAAQIAEKRTMLRVLPEVVRQQPELMDVIHNVLNEAMDEQDRMAANGEVDGDGNPTVPAQRARILANPYPYFMTAVSGDADWPTDIMPRESEDATYQLNKAEQEQQAAPQAAPEQPTGPLAPSVLETPPDQPRRAQPWDVNYTVEQPQDQMTEFERVYGKGTTNPVAELGKLASRVNNWRGYSAQPPSFSPPAVGFDAQNRPVNSHGELVELTNPYVTLPLNVLQSLRRSMGDETAGVELIDEAIALVSAAPDTVASQ